MPWAGLIVSALMLMILMYSFAGIYVSAKYGREMVGSHLQFVLAWQWTLNIIKVVAFIAGIYMVMLVFIMGQGRFFFWDYLVIFSKAVWNFLTVIPVIFWQTMFG